MWTNPFKSMIPRLGDYDINVLVEALKLKDCHVSQHVVFNIKVRAMKRSAVHCRASRERCSAVAARDLGLP